MCRFVLAAYPSDQGDDVLVIAVAQTLLQRGPTFVHLEPQQALLVRAIAMRTAMGAYASSDNLSDAAWPDVDSTPDSFQTQLRVQMCKLRKKLKALRVGIDNKHGSGYRLVPLNEPVPA